jgi:superoxide dismutase, Cu-Zn family
MRGAKMLAMSIAIATLTACPGDREPGTVGQTEAPPTAVVADQQPGAQAGEARAHLINAQGDTVGQATLHPAGEGVHIALTVQGLPPGEKGFHIHAVGSCDPPTFESAGPHFAPQGRQHGFENPQGPHGGDLRNVVIGADGSARQEFTNEMVTLAEGRPNSVFDADGTALVIHAGPDDYRTDPSGDSGDRIACGVVTRG